MSAEIGLPTPTFLPRRYKPRNVGEWTGHLTFASELIVALEPRLLVELGTHWGEAYFTFCQTVQEHGLSTLCYAVDHWMGDEHAGRYGEEVFEEVSQYNDRLYRQFSYLLRRSFDDALAQFADDSVDLLHIDGLHTYDAVKHDFESWLPKVSPGGIILMHDICPRHEDFGVWRLWEEIKSEFPDSFEFHHSWGLGVVRKPGGRNDAQLTRLLFEGSPEVQEDVRRHYVVYASHLEHTLGRMPWTPTPRPETAAEIRVQVFPMVNGGYTQENSQMFKMKAGEWKTLVFDLRDPEISGPIRIDPGDEPSFIEIGDIVVHAGQAGEPVWSSKAVADRQPFRLGGTATAYPDDASFLMNPGNDPQFLLDTPDEVRGPLKLSLTLKVTPLPPAAMEMVESRLQRLLNSAAQERSEAAAELANTKQRLQDSEAQVESTEAQMESIRAQLESTRNELQSARTQLESARAGVLQKDKTLNEVLNSASWRVTAPIRNLLAALRSGPRRGDR